MDKFQINDGTFIRYKIDGEGPPLLLLHTIRNRIEYFDNLIPYLIKYYKIYSIDLPGHGDSPINKKTNYDQQFMTDIVCSFIENKKLTNLTIAGESIGAVLAVTISKILPEKIRKIYCFNPYDYDKKFAEGVSRGNLMSKFLFFHMRLPFGIGYFFSKLECIPILWIIFRGGVYNKKAITFGYIKKLCKSLKKKYFTFHERNVFNNFKSWSNHAENYKNITVPMTLVYGQYDWSKEEERKKTMISLGLKSFETLINTGHFSFLENPIEVTNIIKKNTR